MSLKEVNIYIDEFGNAHLDLSKKSTFSHFVYTAIVIDKGNIEEAYRKRTEISEKYFQKKPIKSNSISPDEKGTKKRLKVLNELIKLNFLVFVLVIDKSKLQGAGLVNKDVFYKYFNKIFLKQFAKNFDKFSIYADKLGYPEFQRSLTSYVYEHGIQRDLFNLDRYYQLADDKTDEPLIQLADFISGCMGKIFCGSHLHPSAQEFFDILHDRLFVDYFPYERLYFEGYSPDDPKADTEIAKIALEGAIEFINSHEKNTSPEAIEVLKYLVLMFKSFPNRLIRKHEILARLKLVSANYSEMSLRHDIQTLRDKGVLIASIKGKSGYKIPNKLEDMIGFYNRYLDSIVPMLSRVKLSHKTLQLKSLNNINLLDKSHNLDVLNELIKVVESRIRDFK
jgi:hypothetical protein